ncbi:16694_t:CDS:2 [Cetraspora pellucida]|uniref:16694_t:CDS:1 n=1 Tax=Cetraspora pellucida TaxID=1433469 RepID=A0ACA9P6F2_9GLOM|nr:16694_t:CDS:2 [Cetraspora pellucida]
MNRRRLTNKQQYDRWQKKIKKDLNDDNKIKKKLQDYLEFTHTNFYVKNTRMMTDEEKIRCGICGNQGHDRRSCSNRFAYNPFNPFNPFASQNSMMFQNKNMMKVPWQTYIIISRRLAEGRTCSYCGSMGHKTRRCLIRIARYPALNANLIRKSLTEYFKDPASKSLRLCGCCGAVGHSQRSCRFRAPNCISQYQYTLIKRELNKFKKEYSLQGHIVPQFIFPKIKKEFY